MEIAKIYDSMIATHKKIGRMEQVVSLLFWDEQVNMPAKGIDARSEQLALLTGEIHRDRTSKRFVGMVNELAAASESLTEDQRVNVREIKKSLDKIIKVPRRLVEELTRHTAKSHMAWAKAREAKKFEMFVPSLTRMLELKKQEALAKADPGKGIYDTLLDDFEPGLDEASAAAILEDLRGRLVPLVHKILSAPAPSFPPLVGRSFPVDVQRAFGLKLIRDIGFDFGAGRQDVSLHPFCTGDYGDVRITTRFFDDDLRPSLFGMLHEAGHALYEQGTDPAHSLTPLGSSLSLGVHESQSRMWENLVGRSLPFWKAYYADLQTAFPLALSDVSMDAFHRFVNQVQGSLIRVEADEATYNLHIILRFEVERDLFADRLPVKDLPETWNRKMKEFLDVEVPDDAQGVLQDIHWSEGLFGYFPTYTLGNLFGAQLYEAVSAKIPDLPQMFENRQFEPLLSWLRENVHRMGKRYSATELVRRATGKEPTAAPFIKYLETKFGEIYRL